MANLLSALISLKMAKRIWKRKKNPKYEILEAKLRFALLASLRSANFCEIMMDNFLVTLPAWAKLRNAQNFKRNKIGQLNGHSTQSGYFYFSYLSHLRFPFFSQNTIKKSLENILKLRKNESQLGSEILESGWSFVFSENTHPARSSRPDLIRQKDFRKIGELLPKPQNVNWYSFYLKIAKRSENQVAKRSIEPELLG